jgi:hypothetical protein
MNAPANIRPRREQYIPAVQAFVQGCEGKELGLRCSLMLMRDYSTKAMRQCCADAHPLHQMIQRLVTEYALAPLSVQQLNLLRANIVGLVSCIQGLETFAFMDGGRDAGG